MRPLINSHFHCFVVLSSLPETKPTGWAQLMYWFTTEPAIFLLMSLFLLHAVWEVLFIRNQLQSIISNLTTNELVNYKRYDYLKGSQGEFFNPFDRGVQKNVYEFFGLIRPQYDWDNLYSLKNVLTL